jgi:hypothetical protein
LFSFGNVAVKRKKGIEEVLRTMVNDKFEWKVVSAGVNFETAGAFSKLMGCLLAPLPVVWIRIAV